MDSLTLSRLLDRGYKKVLFVLLCGLLGVVLAFLALWAYSLLPQGSWQQLPQPPVRLTHFVAYTPGYGEISMRGFYGEIYASTADGTLYSYQCPGTSCEWSKRDALPSPPEQVLWDGACPEGYDKPDASIDKPKAPGRVVSSYEERYCGPDYRNDFFFILIEDGSVWAWNRFESVIGIFHAMVSAVIGISVSFIVGLIVGIVIVVRSSRSAPPPPQ